MRIAMFTETWYPTRDGVVASLDSFRRGLEARGHEVFIFAAGSHATKRANRDERVRFYTGPDWRPYPDYRLAVAPGPPRSLLRALRIDVVHSHGTALMGVKAVRAARLGGFPFLLTFHTRVEDATGYVTKHPAREATLRRLIWTWHGWYFNQCDAIVAPTETVKRDLEVHSKRPLPRLFVIPTGIEVSRFKDAAGEGTRARLGLPDGKVVLTVGRVAWEKNLEMLLDAAQMVARERDDITFAIAGRGPALAHLKARVAAGGLDGTVRFLGFVPDSDLPALYRESDAFVMPSTFETQGVVLLEAMAAGLPVAAADTGGPTHFVRPGINGFLFDGRSAKACAHAVGQALEAPQPLRAMARETAAAYSVERQAQALEGAYEQILGGNAPR